MTSIFKITVRAWDENGTEEARKESWFNTFKNANAYGDKLYQSYAEGKKSFLIACHEYLSRESGEFRLLTCRKVW